MRYTEFATVLAEKAPNPVTELPILGRDQVTQALGKLGFESEHIKVTGNKLQVLVQIPDGAKKNEFRKSVMDDVLVGLQKLLPEFNPKYIMSTKLGSLGGIVFDDSPIAVLVKDIGKQGDNSAGVANEVELASFIESVVQRYGTANITFQDPRGKKMTIKNCTNVDIKGRDTAERKKADVVLSSSKGQLPISIKKLDADMWESADSLFGAKAKEILARLQKQGVIQLQKFKDDAGREYYALNKEIVVEPTEEEAMNAIFGADLNPKGGVVIQTFKPEHYTQVENNILVQCHAVITTKEEIPESHMMVWLIRNNKDRNNPLPGLRTLGVTLTRGIGKSGTKDVVLVDRNGNVVQNPNIKP
jgi:hypothetical protein